MTDTFLASFGAAGDRDTSTHHSTDRELELINRLRRLYRQARDKKRGRYEAWNRNYRLVNNRQSAQASNTWVPAPRDSEIYPGLSSLVGWMTDQEITIDLIPAYDPLSPIHTYVSKIAEDLNEVLYTNWQVESYDTQIKLCLWDALMFSNGIFKAVWDNSLARGYGNAVIRRVDPYSFYSDPKATSLDDAEYLMEVREMSFAEIQRRFPDTAHRLHGHTGGTDAGVDKRPEMYAEGGDNGKVRTFGSLPSAGTYPGTSSQTARWSKPNSDRMGPSPDQSFFVYECWVRGNEKTTDDDDGETRYLSTWRLIVWAEDIILLDIPADALYSHGQHPYEMFTFDDIGEFYGISLVDHLAFPQIYLNRLLTALQQNAELTGNPIWLEAANAGLSRVGVINKPGQRLTMNSNAMAQSGGARWLEPPSMPPSVMQLVEFWIARIENTLGLTALQKGHTPTQRNAEGSLNMVQEAAFVRVRSAMSNLQYCLQRLMAKVCDLIIDNYDENRVMAIMAPDGDTVAKFLAGNHFLIPGRDGHVPLEYILVIEAGANGPTSRAARINEADRLFAMGVIDDQALLQKHRWRNPEGTLSRLYEKRAKGVIGQPGGRQARRKP